MNCKHFKICGLETIAFETPFIKGGEEDLDLCIWKYLLSLDGRGIR